MRSRRTIRWGEFQRLCVVNSDRVPNPVEMDGRRFRWVGIGLVDEGPATGKEVLVVGESRKIKEDWACQIIAMALSEIRTKRDVPRVLEEVSRTALGVRPDLLREFRRLVRLKEKTL